MKIKSEKAITLIALIITIIIMLILAGVVISLTLGENGLFKTSKYAVQKNSEETAREKLEIALADLQAHKYSNIDYNEKEYIDNYLLKEGMKVKQDIVKVDNWQFEIDRSVPKIISSGKKEDDSNKSLLGEISYITKDGYYEVKVNKDSEDEAIKESKYNLHVICHKGNLVLDGTTEIKGATLNNNIYEFGNKDTDVATENENAKNTLVLKVEGNLTINEGVTLTACKSDDGYGGPKGMVISCTGTITNRGTISMTARGAKAEGENIYLWQNEDKNYEYIPKTGGNGGSAVSKKSSSAAKSNGNSGTNGSNRQTGGGGSGSIYVNRGYTVTSGAGSPGTSYSGGSGRTVLQMDLKAQ